jgi:hypothetical protein
MAMKEDGRIGKITKSKKRNGSVLGCIILVCHIYHQMDIRKFIKAN